MAKALFFYLPFGMMPVRALSFQNGIQHPYGCHSITGSQFLSEIKYRKYLSAKELDRIVFLVYNVAIIKLPPLSYL